MITAATVMTVILLIVAAGLPVINTGIDPSSEVYAIRRTLATNLVPPLAMRMGAYQCASQLVNGKDPDSYDRVIEEVMQKLEDSLKRRIKSAVPGYEVREIRVEKANLRSSWDRTGYRATLTVEVVVVVSLSPANSQGLIYEVKHVERFLVSNARDFGGENDYAESDPKALEPLMTLVGFIPVVGNIIDAAREIFNMTKWSFGFNVGLNYYDIYKGDYVTIGALKRSDLWGVERNRKLNEGLEVILLNRHNDKSFSEGFGGILQDLRILTWTEGDKIDWIAVAISLIPGLKYGKFLNKAGGSKSDLEDSESLYSSISRIGSSQNFKQMMEEAQMKVREIVQTSDKQDLKHRLFANTNTGKRIGGIGEDAQKAIVLSAAEKKLGKSKQITIMNQWKEALGEYVKLVSLEGPSSGSEALYSSSSQDSTVKFLKDNDPFAVFFYTTPNGLMTYSGCVWFEGMAEP
ncbi:MAG: hypothetical protein RMJ30_00595 [Nitrososphaerota archaeon]|nr:hypothetical protein [Nitrososphaerota archaeon]